MLVGRGSERSTIDALLAEARAGRSGALVLRGEPGIGKTALLEYAVERAEGFRVLRALGVESESELAFSTLHELLRPILPSLDRIPEPQADALRTAFALVRAAEVERFQVYAATLSLLAEAAEETPVLCVVDDAQWADLASSEAVTFAARRFTEEPVAVLFGAREGETRTFAAPGLPEIHLTGLHQEAAHELLVQTMRNGLAADVAQRVIELSRGNPLALREMPAALTSGQLTGVEALPEPIPVGRTVEQAFLHRIRELPLETQTALLVAAANEAGDSATVYRALAELGLGEAAVDEAERSGLIEITNGNVTFFHPLVRSAVYQAADAVERRRVHRALASVLERDGAVERYPWHLAAAATAPDEAVAAALEEAARSAGERAGQAAQARTYERAARATPDAERRATRFLLAAKAAWAEGLERVETLCREALELTNDPELRGDIHAELETALYWRGDLEAAHRVKVDTAVELEAVAPVKSAHMRARATASLRHFLQGTDAVQFGRDAFELMLAAGGRDPRVPTMYAQALVRTGAAEEAMALAREWKPAVEAAGDESLRSNLADVFRLQEDFATAEALVAARRQRALRASDPSTLASVLEHEAATEQVRGRLILADAAATQSSDVAALIPSEVLQTAESRARVTIMHAERGRDIAAREQTRPALELARRCGSRFLEAQVQGSLGRLALCLGRTSEAIEALEAVREMVRGGGYRHPAFIQFSPELVEAYVRAGRPAEAQAELDSLEAEAALVSTSWALAVAARCRGLVGDEESFERHFVDALAHHERSPRLLERARTELLYGERLRRAGQRVRAREQLRSALEIFESSGADGWAERARKELAASGETVRTGSDARAELTPQELQVALAVARGATNKEAATELFLSTKTIEFHLRNVFRKLGLRSRTELARAFAETRGTPLTNA